MYKTSDTALAAFLVTQGFPLDAIDYANPRYEFIFSDGNLDVDKIKEAATNYLIGEARVDPAVYNRVLRKLTKIVRVQGRWEQ
ncbi:hypothetical protein LCGC14_0917260 [marine sediment metagenome]|uniref:DUF5659 domain-containing protein n=1 Tax=marine sediment metagenome TaxID=412755 RepID=A0A0F9NRW0_9ZZZZ